MPFRGGFGFPRVAPPDQSRMQGFCLQGVSLPLGRQLCATIVQDRHRSQDMRSKGCTCMHVCMHACLSPALSSSLALLPSSSAHAFSWLLSPPLPSKTFRQFPGLYFITLYSTTLLYYAILHGTTIYQVTIEEYYILQAEHSIA